MRRDDVLASSDMVCDGRGTNISNKSANSIVRYIDLKFVGEIRRYGIALNVSRFIVRCF
jgi:hypothetical protein